MTSKEALLYLATTDRNTEIGDEAKKILWELVERNTPLKVVKSDNSSVISANCPKCKRVVDKSYNGCPYCLQRLNWNDEDET